MSEHLHLAPRVRDERAAAGELRNAKAEPWLPIETKLVGWSLGIGVALLIVLAVVNHIYPAAL